LVSEQNQRKLVPWNPKKIAKFCGVYHKNKPKYGGAAKKSGTRLKNLEIRGRRGKGGG